MTFPNVGCQKILIVTENTEWRDFMAPILTGEGYIIKTYSSQEDALIHLSQEYADLIIVDFLSSKVDGLKFCKIIRDHIFVRSIPVLLIVPKDEPLLKAKAAYAGCDDFIERPFKSEEFLTRVKAVLWRVHRDRDINPLTKLAGVSTAIKELDKRISTGDIFAVGYADLYHFRRFNERYNYHKGDEVLTHTASLIGQMLLDMGNASDILTHLREDDFLFITSTDAINDICNKIINKFPESILSFYDEEDKRQQHITVKNRKGELIKVPLLRIHISAVTNEHYSFHNPAQIFQVVHELVNYAKKFETSMYIKERRKSYPFY